MVAFRISVQLAGALYRLIHPNMWINEWAHTTKSESTPLVAMSAEHMSGLGIQSI